MSRHRDIRNMDYSEDYDGYDDVYGHSVDDDIYISPSHRQFMYNRESSEQSKSDFPMEEDIQEEDELEEELKLSEEDKAKLESCIEHVKSVFAPIRMSRQEIVKIILSHKFDCEKIVNSILKSQCSPPTERRDKDQTFNSSNHMLRISLNSNSSSFSQKVEPQSKVKTSSNFSKYDSPNDELLELKKSKIMSVTHPYIVGGPGTSNADKILNQSTPPKNLMRVISDSKLSNIFLSKMPKHSLEIGPEKTKELSSAVSFVSKIKLNSDETDAGNISSKTSLVSNISKHQNVQDNFSKDFKNKLKLNIDFNNVNSDNALESNMKSEDNKVGMTPLKIRHFSKGQDNLEPDITNDIFKNSSSKNPLKLNGMKNIGNDKLKLFLSKIEQKGSFDVLEPTRSDLSLSTWKTQYLSGENSKLKLTEVKSVPYLQNKSLNFNGPDINLTTALQRSSVEKLKFKPVSDGEHFDIPFVDEQEIDEEEDEILECTMDLSHLATKRLQYCTKKPSPMGRMLCLKYSLPKAKTFRKKKLSLDPRLIIFNFSEPSPDDRIKKHMKRNL